MTVIVEALTTLAKIHTMLGIPTATTTDDTYLEELIAAATFAIQEYCGRKFVRRNYNGASGTHATTSVTSEDYIIFSGKGKSRHALTQYPISSTGFVLAELTNRDSVGVETWETLTAGVDYLIDYDTGIITMLNGLFDRGDRNYRVTAAAGYQTQTAAPWVPYDLSQACAVMVREAYRESERLTSEKLGDITRSHDITKHRAMVEGVLDRYRADSNFI